MKRVLAVVACLSVVACGGPQGGPETGASVVSRPGTPAPSAVPPSPVATEADLPRRYSAVVGLATALRDGGMNECGQVSVISDCAARAFGETQLADCGEGIRLHLYAGEAGAQRHLDELLDTGESHAVALGPNWVVSTRFAVTAQQAADILGGVVSTVVATPQEPEPTVAAGWMDMFETLHSPADAESLTGLPPGLKEFLKESLADLAGDGCQPEIVLSGVHAEGFALGSEGWSDCGGGAWIIWSNAGGQWGALLGMQDLLACSELMDAGVPRDAPDLECFDGDEVWNY